VTCRLSLLRVTAALLAAVLVLTPVRGYAVGQPQPAPSDEWQISPELMAQGVGALVGFGAYSLFIAPQAGMVGGRLVAASLAAGGAVVGDFAYDLWTGHPLDYAYFWHRSGFIVGVAAGIAAFGVLGYPITGGSTWLSWAANRVTLIGAGVVGSLAFDRWYGAAPKTP
jgi:hypothetical protein